MASGLTEDSMHGTVTAHDGLLMHKSAALGSAKLTLIPQASRVEILETRGDFYRVRWMAYEGWVWKSYVKPEAAPAPHAWPDWWQIAVAVVLFMLTVAIAAWFAA